MSAKVKEGRIGKHEANGRTSKTVKRERVQAALPVPSPSDDASEWEGFSDSEDGGVALELSALMRVGCASDTAEATLKWSESVAIPVSTFHVRGRLHQLTVGLERRTGCNGRPWHRRSSRRKVLLAS